MKESIVSGWITELSLRIRIELQRELVEEPAMKIIADRSSICSGLDDDYARLVRHGLLSVEDALAKQGERKASPKKYARIKELTLQLNIDYDLAEKLYHGIWCDETVLKKQAERRSAIRYNVFSQSLDEDLAWLVVHGNLSVEQAKAVQKENAAQTKAMRSGRSQKKGDVSGKRQKVKAQDSASCKKKKASSHGSVPCRAKKRAGKTQTSCAWSCAYTMGGGSRIGTRRLGYDVGGCSARPELSASWTTQKELPYFDTFTPPNWES